MGLLKEIINENVEWKKLGKICTIKKGKQFNKRDMLEEGKYPVINGGINPSGFINEYNTDACTITVSQGGASAGYVNFIKTNFWLGAHAYAIVPLENIENRYIYHLIKSNEEVLKNSKMGAGIPSVAKDTLEELIIPVPKDRKVQEKIAKTLDKFSECVTELQAELQERNKQYTYYRDLLLSKEYLLKISKKLFLENSYVENVSLDQFVKIKNGKDWKKLGVGDVPVYGSGGFMNLYVNEYVYNKATVLIPRKGSIGNVFYLDKPFWNVDTIFYTEIDESRIVPKFFYYYMENFDLASLSENSTRPSLTQSDLNQLILTLPSLNVQIEVVKILDKFQEYIQETDGLLPEEISERQKQYVYYREKLLTFGISKQASKQAITPNYVKLLVEAIEFIQINLFDLEVKKLNEIADIYDGTHKTPQYQEDGIPFISVQDIGNIYKNKKYISNEDFDAYKVKPMINDIFMTRIGDIGTCAILDKNINIAYYVTLALIRPNHKYVFSKYLKYLIESKYGKNELSKRTLYNAVPIKINLCEIGNMQFLIPPLEVQKKIISKIEKFEIYSKDILLGLPKEIELRQKQYIYYRDKILNFPKE